MAPYDYKPNFKKPKVQIGMMAAAPMIGAIGSLAGAGASIFSGLQGAGQNSAQLQIAWKNYLLQKQLAEKQMELATAGTQDARGNKTRYIQGIGWVSDPSDMTKRLLGASDREELSRLTEDTARTRRGKQANEYARQGEGRISDAYRRQLENGVGNVSEGTMRSHIADMMLSDVGDKADFAKSALASQAVRSGTTSGKLARDIDDNARTGVRAALARSRYDAPTQAEAQNNTTSSNLMNKYNLMATRAANVEDAPFQPTSVEAVPASMMNRSMTMGPYGLTGASGALGKGMDDLTKSFALNAASRPNYGLMAGGLTEALKQFFKKNNSDGYDHSQSTDYRGAYGSLF